MKGTITSPTPAKRPEKTAGDYIAIALAPLLIMGLVGSLTFFLLEITYEGDYIGRLRWTLFWFVFASVLVSRIAIEHGSGYASLYGLALAAAIGVLVLRYIGPHVGVLLCLAIIWWSTSKLTWDCTLVEEDEDTAGEGLLRVAGLDQTRRSPEEKHAAKPAEIPTATESTWSRLKLRCKALLNLRSNALPHAAGLWVVYFSLAALPVFGIGQLMIPNDQAARRLLGFLLLTVYIGAGLTLLLTTSFLGLRRYLRQRRLLMPGRMAAHWIAVGLALIAGALLISLILPRPDTRDPLTAWVQKISSPDLEASMFHWLGEGADSERSGGARNSKRQGSDRNGRRTRINSPDGQEPSSSSFFGLEGPVSQWSQPGSVGASILQWLRWLVYLLLAIVIVWLLKRYWRQVMQWFRQIIDAISGFFSRIFAGLFGAPRHSSASNKFVGRPRPFSSFQNPFTSGLVGRLSSSELILYSFEALQAWARERGSERRPEQTPLEFAHRLGGKLPDFSDDLTHFTLLYSRIAYAGQLTHNPPLNSIERVWQAMSVSVER